MEGLVGLYALSCVYGIVVNLRFLTRAESSIDYVDSLWWMVHPPNKFVCDFSRQVVASVNIRYLYTRKRLELPVTSG